MVALTREPRNYITDLAPIAPIGRVPRVSEGALSERYAEHRVEFETAVNGRRRRRRRGVAPDGVARAQWATVRACGHARPCAERHRPAGVSAQPGGAHARD